MTELAERQAAASRQGRAFEDTVVVLLRVEGWTIVERKWRHPDVDVEIDIVAVDPHGTTWWIECKGSWEEPTRAGMRRTDSVLKAIGCAALLRVLPDRHPYMVVTSHLPTCGAAVKWVERALLDYFDAVRLVGFMPEAVA